MQNEIQTNREQYQKMISDFKFKFKVKQSQTAQIKMEKINLVSQFCCAGLTEINT